MCEDEWNDDDDDGRGWLLAGLLCVLWSTAVGNDEDGSWSLLGLDAPALPPIATRVTNLSQTLAHKSYFRLSCAHRYQIANNSRRRLPIATSKVIHIEQEYFARANRSKKQEECDNLD